VKSQKKITIKPADQKMNTKSKIQITTSFPNENEKRIDYVIVYKVSDEESGDKFINDAIRDEFFQKLRQEKIEVKLIEFKNEKQNLIYAILHCPNERLMVEAEKIKLAVRINKVYIYRAIKKSFYENSFNFLLNRFICKRI